MGSAEAYDTTEAAMPLRVWAERWLAEQTDRVETQKKRSSTLLTDRYKLRAVIAQLGDVAIPEINAAQIVQYQKQRLRSGRKPPTINGEVAVLKQILLWCRDAGALARIPKIEPIPLRRRRVELPTMAEVSRIVARLPPRVALLIRFLAETGCRKSEAFSLEWADVRQDLGVVMIRRKEGFTPKTDHSDRDVAIGAALLRDLERARFAMLTNALRRKGLPPTLVFPGRTGGRMHNFSKALARAVRQAGVERNGTPLHLSAKAFRKAHVTWQKQRGVDDSLLQPRIGHAPGSRVSAAIYTHITTDAARSITLDLPMSNDVARVQSGHGTT
jgi:integrase